MKLICNFSPGTNFVSFSILSIDTTNIEWMLPMCVEIIITSNTWIIELGPVKLSVRVHSYSLFPIGEIAGHSFSRSSGIISPAPSKAGLQGQGTGKLLAISDFLGEGDCSHLSGNSVGASYNRRLRGGLVTWWHWCMEIVLDWASRELGSGPSSVTSLACECYQEIFD